MPLASLITGSEKLHVVQDAINKQSTVSKILEPLSVVATTGSYTDLLSKPSLGTAAATDSSDYATAAQGVKADTAVQYSDETANFTGNLQQNGDPVVTQKLLDSRLYQEEMFILGF